MPFVFRLQAILEQRIDLRKQAEEELKAREHALATEKKTLGNLKKQRGPQSHFTFADAQSVRDLE